MRDRRPAVGLDLFENQPCVKLAAFPTHEKILTPEQIGTSQALMIRTPKVPFLQSTASPAPILASEQAPARTQPKARLAARLV